MKTKNIMSAILAIAAGTSAYAFTELVETMTVELTDGTTVEYNVDKVEKVAFDLREYNIGMLVTGTDGNEEYKSETFGSLFRYVPAQEGLRVQFLFGTAGNVTTLGDLATGKRMFIVDIAPSALYQGEVALTGTDAPAAIKMYEYTDGEITNTVTELKEGTFSSTRTSKGVLTIEVDATFADGTTLKASYNGTPTDVDDLEELFPTPGPKNEMKYYNMDGELAIQSAITGVKKTVKGDGMWKFAFEFENESADQGYIEIKPESIGRRIDFAEAAEGTFNFKYGSIQLSSPNNEYRNVGVEGYIEITDNGDGTCMIYADVTNKYKTPWGGDAAQGTPERVTFEYNGPCTGLAPVVKNEMVFFNPDGQQINQTEINAVTKKTVRGGELIQYSFDVADENMADDYYNKIYLQIAPALIGEEFDITKATGLVVCYFCNIQVAGANNENRPVAAAGKVKVTDDGEGNITISADVTDLGNQRAVVTYSGTVK